MTEQLAIQQILKQTFSSLKQKNPHYSLRAFSNKLNLNPGTLSSIMNGKRRVSIHSARTILRKLKVGPQKASEVLVLFKDINEKDERKIEPPPPARYTILEEDHFKLIAEWEYYAVLSLMNCHDFDDDPKWIAERLGITEERALTVIKKLFNLRLLTRNSQDKLERVHIAVMSTDENVNLSLRESHKKTLELAHKSLHRDRVEDRDFTYVTMAIDPKKLPGAKEMIRLFQDKLCDYLEDGERSEVYRLSMQLFPFTKLNR